MAIVKGDSRVDILVLTARKPVSDFLFDVYLAIFSHHIFPSPSRVLFDPTCLKVLGSIVSLACVPTNKRATMTKSVFITGAAQGIGLATAAYFHRQGWFVGLYDINEKGLESTHRNLTRSCYGVLDVRDESAVIDAFKDFSLQSGGKVDVVVNCAGVLSSGYFEDIDAAATDRMIDINVKGLTYVARHALPLLKQTPNSVLVNICSASSIYGIPLLGVYGATKHYVNGLTQALSIEWQQFGIRVKAIKPPIVKTAMGMSLPKSFDKHMAANMDAEYVAESIWKSVSGPRVSYILGLKTQCLGLLCRWLPDSLARGLMKRACGL